MTKPPAMPELSRGQIIDLISPLSNNNADHDIEFAHRVIAALQSAQLAEVSDAEILKASKHPRTGMYPWGIGSTEAEFMRAVRAILALRPAQQATPEPSRRPLFAVSVAARKWAELQEQGHRMQSLQFDGGPGGSGSIDPWGKVMWATPEPVGER